MTNDSVYPDSSPALRTSNKASEAPTNSSVTTDGALSVGTTRILSTGVEAIDDVIETCHVTNVTNHLHTSTISRPDVSRRTTASEAITLVLTDGIFTLETHLRMIMLILL